MPKWISINGLDGAISSQLQWSNQVSQSNQMPNLCNYYSFLITCDMFTCLHFICNDWQNQNAMNTNHQTIYYICNGQWLMPADSRRRWSGDCPFALFCLLLACCPHNDCHRIACCPHDPQTSCPSPRDLIAVSNMILGGFWLTVHSLYFVLVGFTIK